MTAPDIIHLIASKRFVYTDEKDLQHQIATLLTQNGIFYKREHHLSPEDITDFFITGLAIEIKTRHPKRQIYAQCLRYAQHTAVTELLLITASHMGHPGPLNGKPFYLHNLNRAWM